MVVVGLVAMVVVRLLAVVVVGLVAVMSVVVAVGGCGSGDVDCVE